ncbi:MAG: cupin domain-containing protein [Deltaproteobacteria bacterium]|nr:cupin domain-containing protein [Deltaproteobacteria bacterium]
MRKLRRIVTGHNKQGKSIVLFDDPPRTFGPAAEIWATDETPAGNQGNADAADRPIRLQPPPRGSLFRYFTIEPESATASLDSQTRAKLVRDMFASINAKDALVDTTRHPAMHTTHTVDYIVLLSGKVTLLLDEGEVDLEPFDVVVQRGTNHAWVNRGDEPALLVGILIDAQPL